MSVGRVCVTGLLLIAAVSSNAIASSRDAKIARIERSLAHAGPAATLRKFFNCDNGIGWDLVSSGEQRAVKIAFALMPETDACYSEIMSVVLGRATSNNPELTLGYYAKFPKTFAEWCVPGLIGATDAEWKAAIDKAERAIRSVRNPALAKAREVCLAEVARARTMPPG